jgi:hypothetical protein
MPFAQNYSNDRGAKRRVAGKWNGRFGCPDVDKEEKWHR